MQQGVPRVIASHYVGGNCWKEIESIARLPFPGLKASTSAVNDPGRLRPDDRESR